MDSFKLLIDEVVHCRKCPRLVKYREEVPAKKPYLHEHYWRRPVPGFGDPKAKLMLVGLAPAPHGGNRTGRPFTGDLSGKFLYQALYKAGFSNQPYSDYMDDGLILYDCYITASVKCVPPLHKPTKEEFYTCNPYLQREVELLKDLKGVLALGKFAYDAFLRYAKTRIPLKKIPPFSHGLIYPMEGLPTLFATYHPSPRNTNTGTLTEKMFLKVLENCRKSF